MQLNFFAIEDKLNVLSGLGDNLERLKVIDWEIFRPELNSALKKTPKGSGGRPPYDYVMMLKIYVLQRLYNISDDQTEYQINDRMSFQRFLGLTLVDKVPDANTIWNFKNELSKEELGEKLFKTFLRTLESENIITHKGTIVDATFVDAPRNRNTKEENEQIKEGKTPEEWEKSENKNKLAQKDVDAKWAKKGNETHYGYKNHTKIDADSKMIIDFRITSANVHDSNVFLEFIDETDKKIYADSAYSSEEIAKALVSVK